MGKIAVAEIYELFFECNEHNGTLDYFEYLAPHPLQFLVSYPGHTFAHKEICQLVHDWYSVQQNHSSGYHNMYQTEN